MTAGQALAYPRCCGSEDGDLAVGVDPAADGSAVLATAWRCNTCGVISIVGLEREGRPNPA